MARRHPLNVSIPLTPEQEKHLRYRYIMLKANGRRKSNSQGQPLEFTLTLDEWAEIWIRSGQYDNMGTAQGQYVMARIDTDRGYTPDNVEILTIEENTRRLHQGQSKNRGRSFNVGITRSEETRKKISDSHKGYKPTPSGTPLQTPDGVFPGVKAAADHYGINVTAIHYFKRKYPNEWYYLK